MLFKIQILKQFDDAEPGEIFEVYGTAYNGKEIVFVCCGTEHNYGGFIEIPVKYCDPLG